LPECTIPELTPEPCAAEITVASLGRLCQDVLRDLEESRSLSGTEVLAKLENSVAGLLIQALYLDDVLQVDPARYEEFRRKATKNLVSIAATEGKFLRLRASMPPVPSR
jgi:hypothetical protein